jgi:hypothetical protein
MMLSVGTVQRATEESDQFRSLHSTSLTHLRGSVVYRSVVYRSPQHRYRALPPSAEALRIWAPALTGRFHRKSAKIGGTGAWSAGAQMPDDSIFAAFHAFRRASAEGGKAIPGFSTPVYLI